MYTVHDMRKIKVTFGWWLLRVALCWERVLSVSYLWFCEPLASVLRVALDVGMDYVVDALQYRACNVFCKYLYYSMT